MWKVLDLDEIRTHAWKQPTPFSRVWSANRSLPPGLQPQAALSSSCFQFLMSHSCPSDAMKRIWCFRGQVKQKHMYDRVCKRMSTERLLDSRSEGNESKWKKQYSSLVVVTRAQDMEICLVANRIITDCKHLSWESLTFVECVAQNVRTRRPCAELFFFNVYLWKACRKTASVPVLEVKSLLSNKFQFTI